MARFAELSESDLSCLLEEKDAENTKKATKVAINLFRSYLQEKRLTETEILTSKIKLATVLEKFYPEARKQDGNYYTTASLTAIRFSLQRFFSNHSIDIIKDPEFRESNATFQATLVKLKREGMAKTQHKPPINKEDINKLYQSGLFDSNSPDTLQNKVFFEVMLYFCRRGRQNLRNLKKSNFSIETDPSKRKYVCKVKDELTKNRRETDEAQETQVMFATGGPLCPVLSFEQYVSHLNPKNEFFFQRPKRVKDVSNDVWYDNMVVGQRTLGEKMKKLSTDAELSYIYTNHSIRATAVTVLDECGYKARHIMAVSGHKSENSIRSYAARTSLSKKRKMSEALSFSTSENQIISDSQSFSIGESSKSLATTSSPEEKLLTLTDSQERFLNEINFQQMSNQQQTVNNYNNCTFNFNTA